MFFWTKTRAEGENRNQKTRRAFRPEGDRLETREVLSTFTLAGSSTPRTALGMTFPTATNGFTGLTTNVSHLLGPQDISTGNRGQVANATSSTVAGVTNQVNRVVNSIINRHIPREAGLANNVNTNLSQINRILSTQFSPFTSSNNPSLTNASAVSSGLAFTNGLGFSNPSSQFTNGFSSNNSAQTGLAFTNGSGFSTPSRSFNGASNGLAFTSSNNASNGLAFTNSSGFSRPTSVSNSASNGLSFLNGLGFTNQNSNPFFNTQFSRPSFSF